MHSAFARNNQVSLQVKTSPRDWSCCHIWPTGRDLDPYGMFYIATKVFWCNCFGNWLLIVEEINFFPSNWWKRFLRSSSFSLKLPIVHMLGWNEHVSSCATVYFHRCTCFTQVFVCASMFVQDSWWRIRSRWSQQHVFTGGSSFHLTVTYPETDPTLPLTFWRPEWCSSRGMRGILWLLLKLPLLFRLLWMCEFHMNSKFD